AWVYTIHTAPALVRPTLGLYIDDPIGVGDTSPGTLLDMDTLSTGACHDQCQIWPPMSEARGTHRDIDWHCAGACPTYAWFIYR
ncbi:hypothetical protein BZG25_15575, partial [Salinivibrio sp. ML198]|uniref:hypothetical protein n=1 Tax=Salinivibrio sp. ML198 TaxID=1909458 RepID=UPI0009D0138E